MKECAMCKISRKSHSQMKKKHRPDRHLCYRRVKCFCIISLLSLCVASHLSLIAWTSGVKGSTTSVPNFPRIPRDNIADVLCTRVLFFVCKESCCNCIQRIVCRTRKMMSVPSMRFELITTSFHAVRFSHITAETFSLLFLFSCDPGCSFFALSFPIPSLCA
jgi:hypothetical protein